MIPQSFGTFILLPSTRNLPHGLGCRTSIPWTPQPASLPNFESWLHDFSEVAIIAYVQKWRIQRSRMEPYLYANVCNWTVLTQVLKPTLSFRVIFTQSAPSLLNVRWSNKNIFSATGGRSPPFHFPGSASASKTDSQLLPLQVLDMCWSLFSSSRLFLTLVSACSRSSSNSGLGTSSSSVCHTLPAVR